MVSPRKPKGFRPLGRARPSLRDMLTGFHQEDGVRGRWRRKGRELPEFLKHVDQQGPLPPRLKDHLWSLAIEREGAGDPRHYERLEYDIFNLLDYWLTYAPYPRTPPERCDKRYIVGIQDCLLRLCLHLNRVRYPIAGGVLFISYRTQMDTLMAAIKRFKDDPSLFPDQECKRKFWSVVQKCQNYLRKTKDTAHADSTHRSLHLGETAPSDCDDDEARPRRLSWLQFLHRDAPIIDPKLPIRRPRLDFTQIIPPGGQKILEYWDWENQNQMNALTVNHTMIWKFSYTGLARRKEEKTWPRGRRVIELISHTGNPRVQDLRDVEGRLIGEWKMRHEVETFTFCARNWLEENNPADAVLTDFLHVYKVKEKRRT